MAMAIDKRIMLDLIIEAKKTDPEAGSFSEWLAEYLVEHLPTLTPPSEWVSAETPPTTQGWYHVAVLDLKTGKYTVEQDLYSIELAKMHGFEPGFCKANRWKERERIDYWCRFPAPPDRRPPKEGIEICEQSTGIHWRKK